MAQDTRWRTSISELMAVHRDALKAIAPIAERVKMSWREPDSYDDWNDIAQSLYKSFVLNSINFSLGWETAYPLPPYDRRVGNYDGFSFVTNQNCEEKSAFICFETKRTTFDACIFANLDANLDEISLKEIPFAEVDFALCLRDERACTLVKDLSVQL
jgi:hypothetical protein